MSLSVKLSYIDNKQYVYSKLSVILPASFEMVQGERFELSNPLGERALNPPHLAKLCYPCIFDEQIHLDCFRRYLYLHAYISCVFIYKHYTTGTYPKI